jgi:PAS domain S-box-containing protein
MMNFHSQRFRLTAFIFTLIASMVTLLLFVIIALTESGSLNRIQARETVLLDFAATICRRGLLTDEYAEPQLFIEELGRNPSIKKIILADHRNRIMISTDYFDIGKPFVPSELSGPTWRQQIIANPAGTMGTLAVHFSHTELETTNRALRRNILLLGLPILLIGAGIAFLLGTMLSRRLEWLTSSVHQIAEGNLHTRVAETGSDEIGSLGCMLNRMTENMQNSFTEISKEMSERRQVEKALGQERDFLDTLIDTIEDGIIACNGDGILTHFNRASENFYGLPQSNLPPEQWADHYELYLADGVTPMPKEEMPRFRALAGDDLRDVEFVIAPKKGKPRLLLANGRPLKDDEGVIIGAVVSLHDITEQRRTEQGLIDSEAALSRAQQVAHVGSWQFDLESNVVHWSPEAYRLFNIAEGTAVNYDDFLAIIHPDDREQVDRAWQAALHGEPYDIDHRMLVDGMVRWLNEKAEVEFDPQGKPVRAVGSVHDITERKEADAKLEKYRLHLEEQVLERTLDLDETQNALLNMLDDMTAAREALEAANIKLQDVDRIKSMFIASMSHELRTPLNSVIGFSSILLDEWLGPLNDEQKLNMGSILRSGQHLLSLINDVIDISKIEAGTLEAQVESFDLAELLAEAAEFLRKSAEDKGLSLVLPDIGDPVPMHTDRRRLLQILINFLSNGIKFTDKGEVSLSVEQLEDGDRIAIMVRDTGLGIAESNQGKLFKPFSRLHDSGTSVYPGTGLGLYLCKKITREILDGEVDMQSIFGKGSTFRVILPMRIEK